MSMRVPSSRTTCDAALVVLILEPWNTVELSRVPKPSIVKSPEALTSPIAVKDVESAPRICTALARKIPIDNVLGITYFPLPLGLNENSFSCRSRNAALSQQSHGGLLYGMGPDFGRSARLKTTRQLDSNL